jgi:zinc transport system substrate-binding protein
MKRNIFRILALTVLFTATIYPAVCLGASKIYVTNYPLKYFTERIAGNHFNVILPVPRGLNPIFWMPSPKTLSAMQKSDLIILNGATYEKWLALVSLPQSKLVDTSVGFKKRYIQVPGAITHSHGQQGEHSHMGIRFTTWLDFEQAALQAKAVAAALSRKWPSSRHLSEENLQKLEKDLIGLDQNIQKVVGNNSKRPLIVSHPVYDYFARRYRLNIKSLLWSPTVMPNPNQWMDLRAMLKQHLAKRMLWEGNPLEVTAEKLKALHVDSLVFDPCGNVPDQGDFLTIMKQNIENLKMAFEE